MVLSVWCLGVYWLLVGGFTMTREQIVNEIESLQMRISDLVYFHGEEESIKQMFDRIDEMENKLDELDQEDQ
jgi:hypothetical protein